MFSRVTATTREHNDFYSGDGNKGVPRLSRNKACGLSPVRGLCTRPSASEGGTRMAGEFACVACGIPSEKDDVVLIQECRLCRRSHCDRCLNEEGICVDCAEK